jgi:gas vesicle protein
MKRKLLLIVGLSIGYVLGARAGREKYDSLKEGAENLWRSPRVTKAREDVEAYARTQAPIVLDRAEVLAGQAAASVKNAADKTVSTAKDAAAMTAATAQVLAGRTATTAKEVADKTATTAKEVADKTATTAKEVADRTSTTAKNVAERVGDVTDDVKDRAAKTAADLKERGEDAVERVTLSVSEARDRALEDDLDDENDEPTAK